MMYYDQSRATYDEAVAFCANYDAQLVEIWNEDEWLKVKYNYYPTVKKTSKKSRVL